MAMSSVDDNGGGGERTNDAAEAAAAAAEATATVVGHPYDFHVSGPRNLSSPIGGISSDPAGSIFQSSSSSSSSNYTISIDTYILKDPNYRRMVIACFIQAVYLLELDRQENKSEDDGLAPKWWKPFKYKLSQTLVDERDGSIYGAVLEWDRTAALSDFIVIRPSGAPKAVLAVRGTLLKSPTIRRDLEDDLRFLAWESLKGSVRFVGTLETVKALVAASVRSIGEKASNLWGRVKASLPSKCEGEEKVCGNEGKRLCTEMKKWVPHLYVNSSDYICSYYTSIEDGNDSDGAEAGNVQQVGEVAKLFVMSKGPQKFLEAHGLQQWWSGDAELQLALHHSKLINRQLRSLYTMPPTSSTAKS
uniref:Uncharacterized protein n=1 Tax=Ananas comosus var. bracteatus TaxID=296719 RepID=A0A6V7PU33_ANACO|nr:unnamed protein product [Ananas comosus var. bracteatus]